MKGEDTMRKIYNFFSDIVNNVWFGIKTSYCASKKYFLAKCIILCSTTVIPLLSIWIWKTVINAVPTGEFTFQLIMCLTAYLLFNLCSSLLGRLDEYISGRYSDELMFYIDHVMIKKTARMDLAFFDSASMGDRIQATRENFSIMTDITWLVFNILSESINLVLTFVIVCTYRWWLGFAVLIFLIPYTIYNKKKMERDLRIEREMIRDNRKMGFYLDSFLDNDIQFEIKLNNIGTQFIHAFQTIHQKVYRTMLRENIRHGVIQTLMLILNLFGEITMIIISVLDVMKGRIGIGDLQYNLSIVTMLREQASQLMADLNKFLVDNRRLNELKEFIDFEPEIEKSGTKIPSANPKIEFCGVSFRYPNTEQYVLKDCSFIIEPHEKIGLIGLNGAGKSTIIKLMFRFYDPEEGQIMLDGVNLKEYDVYAVRKVFGVLFQDYVTYSLPLREIIALPDFDERFNDEKLKKACDISGVSGIIKDWKDGFDSVLGRNYADNGKDLSGGQWQLVGLARAYFKETEYMILDEPSAALDPISEDRIFEQLYHLSEGKSSVTISHRLSNTTLADKILVVGDGHIIEQGSHLELIKQNGEYARLFNLQASKYL